MQLDRLIPILLVPAVFFACSKVYDDIPTPSGMLSQSKVGFNIEVTRDGVPVPTARQGRTTKGANLDAARSFGLIGIDYDHHNLVIDNAQVNSDGSNYSTFMDKLYWNEVGVELLSFSAYYPYVNYIDYDDDLVTYSIPYSAQETDAGPLVSKTVEMAVQQLNIIPLEFQHITNDIGYCICDVTPKEELQGLIHLRKLTAYNVASAGVFVNDVTLSRGIWHRQGYYRNVVIFDGDAHVGVGTENEKFVGFDTLEDHLVNSHRYYSIPDDIVVGKQYVEAVFDVDGFTHNGVYYSPLQEQVAKYMLYGLLENNVFEYGRQYTFHIGLDLSSVYHEITFAPSVADWQTKIYEDNTEF